MVINKWHIPIFILLLGCSAPKIERERYSRPKWQESFHREHIKKVVFAATSNFNGNLFSQFEIVSPKKSQTEKNSKGINHFHSMNIGGVEIISSYINILRNRYPHKVVLLDAGGIFSSDKMTKENRSVLKFYEYLKYDAVIYTDQEYFSFKDSATSKIKTSVPFIATNIIDLKTGNSLKRDFLLPYKIITVNGVKIGILGVTSFSAVKHNKNGDKLKGIYFEDPILSILKARKVFKRAKVSMVVLISSLNSSCKEINNKKTNPQLKCLQESDELYTLVKRLPPNSIDLIVTNSASFASGYVGNIPVLQTPGEGKYFGHIEIYFDTNKKEIVNRLTVLHTPTKFCHLFFTVTDDCFIEKKSANNGSKRWEMLQKDSFATAPAQFLGHKVEKDSSVVQNIKKSL